MAIATDNYAAGTSQDQRRDKRFQVSQAAIVSQPGHPDVICEIRDFCQGGLFLRFTNPEAAIASLKQRTDSAVEVVFTPGALTPSQTFRVAARIRRMSLPGLGVTFERQPIEALRALQKLRMAEHRQKLFDLPPSDATPRLRQASTTLLNETLLQVHDHMMRMLGDELSVAAAHANGIAEHSALLASVDVFRQASSDVKKRFVDAVLDAVHSARPVHAAASRTSGEAELALVDEKDFEDWLATSSEAHKLEEQYQEQLLDIEPRIGQLFAFPCDRSNNPFGPVVIGHAYRSALHDLAVPQRARQVAYLTLRSVLSEQLAPLYAELLALLPVSQAEVFHQRDVAADAAEASAPTAAAPAEETVAQPHATAPGTTPRGTSGAAPAARGALSQLTGSLLDFFRGQPPHTTAASTAASTATGAGRAAGVAPAVGAAMAMPGVANSPVLQRLAASGRLPAAPTPEGQRSVDMFGALFDTMHAQRSINEGIRPFFEQMESSLLKLAMDDPNFLASPAHPAHKVLNTLERISMAAGDDGKISDTRLLRLMNRWTDRINAEADKNPGVFDEARTQLERVVKPLLNERAARVFRLQEMCEGRQRAEVAKHRILTELLRRLDEKRVPNAVIELLNGGWRNVLLIAELRHGVDSDEARGAWQILTQLCVWLDPDQIEAPTTAEIQNLLQQIDEALTQVCADKFAQDRIVDQLATALFDENKSEHQYTSVASRLDDAGVESLTESQDTLVERLRVGDWLQFTTLDAPLNLIWIGDQPPVYVFANYRGIKKLDLKRRDFLNTLESGGAAWTEDLELPLMDRSYSAMIQKMQRDLMWQSSHDAATGLLNRKSFFRAIRRHWLRSPSREAGYVIAVIQLDIASTSGATVGAEIRTPILRSLAERLPGQLPPNALLARAGESGLACWIEATDGDDATARATALMHFIMGQPQEFEGTRYRVSPAIGLMWARDCLSPEAYYDNANAASTRARESSTPVVLYSSEGTDGSVRALAQWAHELTDILVNNQLSLNCQPVIATSDASATALYYEILLHPRADDERIVTRDLIDVAERLQRITEIDRWVARQVFQWMRAHPAELETLGGFSINLSGQSVNNPLFLKFMLGELASGEIPGDKLIFEISEIDAIDGHAQTQLFMRQLQRHGCRFTLDEFGAGSSSFTRLKGMKLDYLKIDRTLVREVTSSMIDEALVRSIVETGSFLGIKTVAGYVENDETLGKLTEMGVDCMQGYLIGAPQPLDELAARLLGA